MAGISLTASGIVYYVVEFSPKVYAVIHAGENRPTLKLLNRHVKKEAANKWYDLGIELLENEDVEELNVIRNNHPNDAGTCCTEMFQLWLRKQPKATWKQLIQALKQPGIEMNELANKIEQILASITQGIPSSTCQMFC